MADIVKSVDRWDHPLYLTWLDSLPVEAAAAVVSAVDYLTEHGRSAQLDLVRNRIQTSKHFPNMSEARIRYDAQPHSLILRVLTVFTNNDTTLVVCFAGDKAKWARTNTSDWYDTAIPIADQVFDRYKQLHPEVHP
jgi:hypothetical protein